MLGKTEGKRRGGQQRKWLDSIINSVGMNVSKLREIVEDREAWHASAWLLNLYILTMGKVISL